MSASKPWDVNCATSANIWVMYYSILMAKLSWCNLFIQVVSLWIYDIIVSYDELHCHDFVLSKMKLVILWFIDGMFDCMITANPKVN
jgi:hypothetical protein